MARPFSRQAGRRADGEFLSVLWENLCEPILTGREELGFSKIYCELPSLRRIGNTLEMMRAGKVSAFSRAVVEHVSHQRGRRLAALSAPRQRHASLEIILRRENGIGKTFAIPFFRRAADPDGFAPTKTVEAFSADAVILFANARWEDMPTQYMIVNALAALPLYEARGATITSRSGQRPQSSAATGVIISRRGISLSNTYNPVAQLEG